jgi:Helix-turn-helix domain
VNNQSRKPPPTRALSNRETKALGNLLALADPQKIGAAIEKERRARSRPGWHGLTVAPRADWQLSLKLGTEIGTEVRQVTVDSRSHPYRSAGLRTGNFVGPLEVNGSPGVNVEDFDALGLPIGTVFRFKFWQPERPGHGWMIGEAVLIEPPRTPKVAHWKTKPRIPAGRRVDRKERRAFLDRMAVAPDMPSTAFLLLSRMLLHYDNPANQGCWPSYQTLADDLGIHRQTVIRLIGQLCWLGALKRVSGPTADRSTNVFQITWPGRNPLAVTPRITGSL